MNAGRGEGAELHVVVAGGGTAGHVEPAMSLADAVMRRCPTAEVTAVGTEYGLEAKLVPSRGYALRMIPRVAMPREVSFDAVKLPARLWSAVAAAKDVLTDLRPHVVVGFGGYVSLPVYLAARNRGIPVVVHEANAKPGIANRIGARLTPYVAVASQQARLPHAELIGIPLRRAIATLDRLAERAQARNTFGLRPDLPTLLVFGGSQGARTINAALASAAAEILASGIQILHAVGPGNDLSDLPPSVGGTERPPYVAVPYLDRMDLAYAAADLALCRSGAMTCAELAAVGLPGVFVPYPHSNGEQELNAMPLVSNGGGFLLNDAKLDGATLRAAVVPVLVDPEMLSLMQSNARAIGMRDADERLVDLVLRAVGGAHD